MRANSNAGFAHSRYRESVPMRHRITGKQLSRTTSHRKALRRGLAASLIQHGAFRTTGPKAKELRRFVERIITIAREGTLHARRRVLAELGDRAMTDNDGEFLDKSVVQKLFDEIAPRYADRPGGYTRIIRLDERRIGDAGEQVIIQLVEEEAGATGGDATKTSRRRRRATKRHEAASVVKDTEQPEADEDAEESGPPESEETPDDEQQQDSDESPEEETDDDKKKKRKSK